MLDAAQSLDGVSKRGVIVRKIHTGTTGEVRYHGCDGWLAAISCTSELRHRGIQADVDRRHRNRERARQTFCVVLQGCRKVSAGRTAAALPAEHKERAAGGNAAHSHCVCAAPLVACSVCQVRLAL